MGLDNYIIVKSRRRTLTREMLPKEIEYPYDKDFVEGEIELLYHRKNWGIRNAIIHTCFMTTEEDEKENGYVIDKPQKIFDIMKIILSFMDEEVWNNDGQSIWEYHEIENTLRRDVMNLAIIAAFMEKNPDVYLIFVDSY